MGHHAVLAHLTHAAESLQAAHDLAVAAGDEVLEQVIQRSAVFTASAIDLTTQPVHTSAVPMSLSIIGGTPKGGKAWPSMLLAGVLQPPVKIRERGQVKP